MRLRYKLNLIAVGYWGLSALLGAANGQLFWAIGSGLLAWANWHIALKSEKKEN